MTKVLVLGAGGQIARHVIGMLAQDTSVEQTLYLRHKSKLGHLPGNRVTIVEGDVLDAGKLREAMRGKDIVYANLDGPVDKLAKGIVDAMKHEGLSRLIFITSMGIYDEVPGAFGKWNNQMIGDYLVTYRKAADIIEASDLEYTILRPAWLTDDDEVDYETTKKGEAFKGTEVSRKSVADLVVKLIRKPKTHVGESLGVDKPGTEGDKPSFY